MSHAPRHLNPIVLILFKSQSREIACMVEDALQFAAMDYAIGCVCVPHTCTLAVHQDSSEHG